MLAYLQTCFCEWPADLTFKMVMETWLSAVQPWRYVDSYQHPNDHDSSAVIDVPENWTDFVVENYGLYSALLLLFARRLLRMDLVVARNAYMVFRVAKVFGQPSVARFIHYAHEARFRGQLDQVWVDVRSQMSLVFSEIDSVLFRYIQIV